MSIAITPYVFLNKYKKICYSINKEWSELASKINEDIFMLCDLSNFNNLFKKINVKAVILSGGGDISKIKNSKINKLRDAFELKLAKFCFKRKIPVIAVCRGFELLASNEGCLLKKVKTNSKRNQIHLEFKNQIKSLHVNSFHNYKIFNLNSDFKILGKCKDGSIEVALHKKKKLLCLMMHPERSGNNKIIIQLFKNFIK